MPDQSRGYLGEGKEVSGLVEVRLTGDGSRWRATVFTLAEVERLMERWSRTDEALGGRYFWCSDGLIVRDPGIDNMALVLAGLLDSGGAGPNDRHRRTRGRRGRTGDAHRGRGRAPRTGVTFPIQAPLSRRRSTRPGRPPW